MKPFVTSDYILHLHVEYRILFSIKTHDLSNEHGRDNNDGTFYLLQKQGLEWNRQESISKKDSK